MNEQRNHKADAGALHPERSPREENSPRIEYLQRAIVGLLMKNETLQFELIAIRQKIAIVHRTVFGVRSHELNMQFPPHVLGVLRDLCSCEVANRETPGSRGTE
jgi:hypothetical protein